MRPLINNYLPTWSFHIRARHLLSSLHDSTLQHYRNKLGIYLLLIEDSICCGGVDEIILYSLPVSYQNIKADKESHFNFYDFYLEWY